MPKELATSVSTLLPSWQRFTDFLHAQPSGQVFMDNVQDISHVANIKAIYRPFSGMETAVYYHNGGSDSMPRPEPSVFSQELRTKHTSTKLNLNSNHRSLDVTANLSPEESKLVRYVSVENNTSSYYNWQDNRRVYIGLDHAYFEQVTQGVEWKDKAKGSVVIQYVDGNVKAYFNTEGTQHEPVPEAVLERIMRETNCTVSYENEGTQVRLENTTVEAGSVAGDNLDPEKIWKIVTAQDPEHPMIFDSRIQIAPLSE